MIRVGDAVYKAVLGPKGLDLTPYFVTVRTRTWASGRIGKPDHTSASYTDSDLCLPPHFPIRQISNREISESGGRFERGDVIVEDISPAAGCGVGYTARQLKPLVPNDGVQILYVIATVNPRETEDGLTGFFNLREGQFDDWQYYQLVLRRTRETPTGQLPTSP